MDPTELAQLLAGVEPAALLVPARLLRRVIKHDRRVPGMGLQVPHRRCLVIPRDRLRGIVDADELRPVPEAGQAPVLLLLDCPEAEDLAATPREEVLLRYWRLLFHCRVHLALAERLGDGEAGLRRRIL